MGWIGIGAENLPREDLYSPHAPAPPVTVCFDSFRLPRRQFLRQWDCSWHANDSQEAGRVLHGDGGTVRERARYAGPSWVMSNGQD